jgi:hypothetical protein
MGFKLPRTLNQRVMVKFGDFLQQKYLAPTELPDRHGSVVVAESTTAPEFKVVLPRKPKRVLLNANHDILSAENVVTGK